MITLNAKQHLKDDLLNSFSLFYICLSHHFLFYHLFQALMQKETSRLQSISHIVYFECFCYLMYYNVLEICIGGRFVGDCFYCNSQQIIYAVANESLIPYNIIKRAPETQSLKYCNTKCQPKANKRNCKIQLSF